MFGLGAKTSVPNNSQYDFKGTSVSQFINLDEAATKFVQTNSVKSW